MRTSRRMLKQVRRAMGAAFLFSGFITVLMLATPLFILQIYQAVVPLGRLETLGVLALVTLGAIAAQSIVEVARDLILARAGLWLDHELGLHMLDNGMKRQSPESILSADAEALAGIRSFLAGPAAGTVFSALTAPLLIAGLFALDVRVGATALAAALLLLAAAVVAAVRAGGLHAESRRAGQHAADLWAETVAGTQSISALGLARAGTDMWETANRTFIATSYAAAKRSIMAMALSRACGSAALVAVFALGSWLVVDGAMAPGTLVAAAVLMTFALSPFMKLAGHVHSALEARAGFRRLAALPPDAVAPRFSLEAAVTPGDLTLAGVSFTYPGRTAPALSRVSLTLGSAECLAITGNNGAGKSTLAALMAGAINPASGTAGLGGVAIAKWQEAAAEPVIGYAPAEPMLLDGSVAANITRFADVSPLAAAHAALRVGVHDIIESLPHGYATPAGRGGRNLSPAERRAVCLARAVCGAPAIVILDGPEAGRDAAGLRRVADLVRGLKAEGRSVVLATCEPQFLALADRTIVLEQGTIVSEIPPAHASSGHHGMSGFAVRPLSTHIH